MLGPLSAEERREARRWFWTPELRRYQMTVLVGSGITLFGLFAVWFTLLSTPIHPGFTESADAAIAILLVGVVVLVLGTGLRSRAFRQVAVRPCPSCGQPNLRSSAICRKCGVALPTADVGASAPPRSGP